MDKQHDAGQQLAIFGADRAAKARLIRRVDYAPNKSPTCHASPKSVWVWVG